MPPKVRFTKEEVIKAAFRTVEEFGFNEMSTQQVAENLNSSVQPLYSHFENIKALKQVVVTQTLDIYKGFVFREFCDSNCVNPWMGEVLFAKKYPQLYFALFVERNDYEELFIKLNHEIFNLVSGAVELNGLHNEKALMFYRNMQIYTYGFAIMVCNNYWKNKSEDGIIRAIREYTSVLLKDAHNSKYSPA